MELVRCECCAGRKQMLSLGGLVKDCKECKGVGVVEYITPAKKEFESSNRRVRRIKEKLNDNC